MEAASSSSSSSDPVPYAPGRYISLLDESSPRADQPTGPTGAPPVGIQLRPHQLALLARCREFENGTICLPDMPDVPPGIPTTMQTCVGVIGDKAGAGKSYVILSMVLEDKRLESLQQHPERQSGRQSREVALVRSMADNRVVLTSHENVSTSGITILVIPHNLCGQWMDYISKFGGGLVAALVSKTRHLALLRPPSPLDSLDLIVVTSTYYNNVTVMLRQRQVRRLVFDEADSVVIPRCHTIKAGFCWFATASYQNLLRPRGTIVPVMDVYQRTLGVTSSGFIKTLFSDLDYTDVAKATAEALIVRNADEFVDASITLPDPEITMVRCHAPRVLRVLAGFVDVQVMQHLNAGDVEGALQHINPNNRQTEENLVNVILDKMKREAHAHEVHLNMRSSLNFHPTARITARLDEIRARMNGICDRITGSDTCSICLNEFDNKTVVPCCSNAFCFSCISRWVAKQRPSTCPLCKAALGLKDLLIVSAATESADVGEAASSSSSSSDDPPPSLTDDAKDKLGNFEAILRERCAVPGRTKMLVFSSFDNSFQDITRVLSNVGVRYKFLKGNVPVLSNIVREYRTGTLDVLLVNSNHYGSGLNFENTTDMVIWHKSNWNIEHQIIGRAQRSGRTDPLKVWYLVYDTEVMEAAAAAEGAAEGAR